MIYYATPSTEAIKDAMSAQLLGCITTPHQGLLVFPDDGWDVIADNGAFSGRWREEHWRRWLLDQPRSMRFAVCPDLFDPSGAPCHLPTLERWERYSGTMRRCGFVPAFVCQVGCTYETVPADAEVLFLGGDDGFKLGPIAEDITRRAVADGRWVHMGRVNSRKRMRLAHSWGCQSVDGTLLKYGPDKWLPSLLRWLDQVNATPAGMPL